MGEDKCSWVVLMFNVVFLCDCGFNLVIWMLCRYVWGYVQRSDLFNWLVSWVIFVQIDGVVGVNYYLMLFYQCSYMYGVMCVFYEYQEGGGVWQEIIVQGDIVSNCGYIEFVNIVVDVVICSIFVDCFRIRLQGQVRWCQVSRVVEEFR